MRCTKCGTREIRYDYGTGRNRRYRWSGRQGPAWFWNSSHAKLNSGCYRCGGSMEVLTKYL
jgi:hypothetical protein